MYSHISAEDHKNIAGIAYLQSKLKELNPKIKIDGMFGAESISAFHDAIEQGLKIKDFRVDLKGTGMGLIQNMIRQAIQIAERKDFPVERLHDNQWGDGTKKAIDLILKDALFHSQVENVREFFEGKRPVTKLTQRTLKSVQTRLGVRSTKKPTPPVYENRQLKQGIHWCCGMEYENTPYMCELLAKAMNFDTPTITVANMLASGWNIALSFYRGRPVGILVIRSVDAVPALNTETELKKHAYIEGIYVNKNNRLMGHGGALIVNARHHLTMLGYDRIIFVRGPSEFTLEETLDGCRNEKDRMYDRLVRGYKYRQVGVDATAGRPDRCILNLK